MARFFGTGLGKRGLYLLGIVALLAIGALVLADTGMLSGADAQPAERAIQPIGAQEATPEPLADTADKTVSEDIAESEDKTDQIERAVQEPGPRQMKRLLRRQLRRLPRPLLRRPLLPPLLHPLLLLR